MANKAAIINGDTQTIVEVPDALVQVGGVWTIAATSPGTVPATRQINTTAPLTGGGDLSADRTIAIPAATVTGGGYMTTTQVSTLATASTNATTALADAAAAQATANAALVKANNLSDLTNASTARTNLGLGTAATQASTAFATAAQGTLADGAAQKSANLSDLANASTARTNLGLGSVATLAADTDTTLAADSNSNVATQHAVKTYVDNLVTGVMKFKGSTDCSGNPNYPSAKKGEAYVVSVAGKIGGASGLTVEVGDVYVAIADNAGGTQAAVGSSWDILQYNLVGALLAANNLSDLSNATTARTNLGLGSAATTASTDYATAAQGALAASAVQRAGDTMSGTLTIGSGGNLVLSGGAASGQGNIQMTAAASAVYDTNLLYLDNSAKTMGFVAGATPAFVATSGPFFAARGNTYSSYANQRGNMFFYAGSPTSPSASEGSLAFATANTVRMFVDKDGKITLNNGSTSGTGVVNVAGSTSSAGLGETSVIRVSTNFTAYTNGDVYHTYFSPAITKTSTGTHATVVGVLFGVPTFGGGAATVTTAATVIILGAPTAGTSANYALWSQGGVSRFDGKLSVGLASGSTTALLHIKGGTASANTAPLKFTSGTNLTIPEAGAMEYNGTLSFTDSSAARKDVALKTTYTPTLTPAQIAAAGYSEQTFTVTGLATTDTVIVNGPAAAANSVLVHARVSAADTLALTWITNAATITPTSGTYRIVAIRG